MITVDKTPTVDRTNGALYPAMSRLNWFMQQVLQGNYNTLIKEYHMMLVHRTRWVDLHDVCPLLCNYVNTLDNSTSIEHLLGMPLQHRDDKVFHKILLKEPSEFVAGALVGFAIWDMLTLPTPHVLYRELPFIPRTTKSACDWILHDPTSSNLLAWDQVNNQLYKVYINGYAAADRRRTAGTSADS